MKSLTSRSSIWSCGTVHGPHPARRQVLKKRKPIWQGEDCEVCPCIAHQTTPVHLKLLRTITALLGNGLAEEPTSSEAAVVNAFISITLGIKVNTVTGEFTNALSAWSSSCWYKSYYEMIRHANNKNPNNLTNPQLEGKNAPKTTSLNPVFLATSSSV